MTSKMTVENRSGVEFTLSVTMKLSDWLKLKDQFESSASYLYPGDEFYKRISEMVYSIEKEFYPELKP